MNEDEKIVYMNAQVACALIELEGKKAENATRAVRNLPPTYNEVDFLAIIERYGIHSNSVLTWFHGS